MVLMNEGQKLHNGLLGSVIGDIVGSVFEWDRIKTKEFPLFSRRSTFTDDTVMTIATAEAVLKQGAYGEAYHSWGNRYPGMSYGNRFRAWLQSADPKPYGSWGNGSAMRVSPVAFAFDTEEQVLAEARKTALPTHGHAEGIKGAEATALAIFLARTRKSKAVIRSEIERRFGYNLGRTVDQIRPTYKFDESCQRTVPEAITAFLDSKDYEDAIRNAVSLGGDSDTIACITGGIAAAYYTEIPEHIIDSGIALLKPDLVQVLAGFETAFPFQ
jgi:ADP-ribosylglycohydrolase